MIGFILGLVGFSVATEGLSRTGFVLACEVILNSAAILIGVASLIRYDGIGVGDFFTLYTLGQFFIFIFSFIFSAQKKVL